MSFDWAVVSATEEGVCISPDRERLRAVGKQMEQQSKKEVESYLGQVRALAAWFPGLVIKSPCISINLEKGNHLHLDKADATEV